MTTTGNVRVLRASDPDPVFSQIRREAEEALRREPELGCFLTSSILNHSTLEQAVGHRMAARLSHSDFPGDLIRQNFLDLAARDPSIGEAVRADILAFADRDPACQRLIEPVLYFKGFHALQTHRLAHALWNAGRKDFALYLQSRSSAAFQTDINPAARIGKGLFLDHATGLVVGATAVIEDDVSILHSVTLGGTGHERGDRHPKIRHGVLIGAGAKIIGNIEIGNCSRIAAGSVVLKTVPANVTVAGVPAKIVGASGCAEPAREMDQVLAAKAEEDDERSPFP
ncbi:serine O-acetyltransferase [Rhodoblastus sp.]|jgi:serine O-acetyltransferase|uniref:serine O-acetyltransferase n=1 Tax=Rhodoblastus sp. TaxID=1962975 RepID=UPI002610479C|nr:serine O-acetyltransferase [Rhodoblastus sp.]